METFSALLAFCAGNSPVQGEFPAQRPVTRSSDVFFDLRPNKRLSKQSSCWWSETPSSSLWRHRNVLLFCHCHCFILYIMTRYITFDVFIELINSVYLNSGHINWIFYYYHLMINHVICFHNCAPDLRESEQLARWRHQIETSSVLLALCARNSPVTDEFHSQRPVTQGFGVLFDLRLNKPLGKQSGHRWFETPSRSLWRLCNYLLFSVLCM